jgi:uncharacterized phage protein (TIGR01671 family)
MNREIKFRAFNIIKREMILPEMLFINTESDGGSCSLFTTISNLSKEYILMQFTGLKDGNGKEIYEGDVVELFGYKKPVDYYEGAFGYWNEIDFISYNKNNHNICFEEGNCMIEAKVIGNIYENPEILISKTT